VADRLQKPGTLASKVLNLATVGLILVARPDLLTAIRPRSVAGMLALLLASWAAGWLLGGPGPDTRKVLTLTTSLRNVGVGLVIATGAFAGTPAVLRLSGRCSWPSCGGDAERRPTRVWERRSCRRLRSSPWRERPGPDRRGTRP
jgi:hypothetical protein